MEIIGLITAALPLIAVLVLVGSVAFAVLKVRGMIRQVSQRAFGTANFLKGAREVELESRSTPRSLTGVEKFEIPQLQRDFPELSIDRLKTQNEDMVLAFFECVDTKKVKKEFEEEHLKHYVTAYISDCEKTGTTISNVKIHRQVVSDYKNIGGKAAVTFQMALEFVKTTKGKPAEKQQHKIKTVWIYVYDLSKLEHDKVPDSAMSINCPNCGAPVTRLGDKFCEHCGTGVIIDYEKTWHFNDIDFMD